MKRIIAFSTIALACIAPVQAVDFNTDALKSMQKEGHAIVAEAEAARVYKASNGQCLAFSASALVLENCNGSKNQKWSLDGNSRLVAANGKCADGAHLKACGNSNAQKWKHDSSRRLMSQAKKCLQPEGNPPKKGARVVAANCSKSSQQVWK
ncbi:MAG: RICIN domain-containing protein [Halioglobus sp.]